MAGYAALPACEDVDLNGRWEYGIDRNYTATTMVPGIPLDATCPHEGRLWYRRRVTLPCGAWNSAVLELKGARFRPEVYVNGERVSSQEGGMIRSLHRLDHPSLKPSETVTLSHRCFVHSQGGPVAEQLFLFALGRRGPAPL